MTSLKTKTCLPSIVLLNKLKIVCTVEWHIFLHVNLKTLSSLTDAKKQEEVATLNWVLSVKVQPTPVWFRIILTLESSDILVS